MPEPKRPSVYNFPPGYKLPPGFTPDEEALDFGKEFMGGLNTQSPYLITSGGKQRPAFAPDPNALIKAIENYTSNMQNVATGYYNQAYNQPRQSVATKNPLLSAIIGGGGPGAPGY